MLTTIWIGNYGRIEADIGCNKLLGGKKGYLRKGCGKNDPRLNMLYMLNPNFSLRGNFL